MAISLLKNVLRVFFKTVKGLARDPLLRLYSTLVETALRESLSATALALRAKHASAVFIVQSQPFHEEVVAALCASLGRMGIPIVGIFHPRLLADASIHSSCVEVLRFRSKQAEFLGLILTRAGSPVIFATDWSSNGLSVPADEFSRKNLMVLVHNFERFSHAHKELISEPATTCVTPHLAEEIPRFLPLNRPTEMLEPPGYLGKNEKELRLALVGTAGGSVDELRPILKLFSGPVSTKRRILLRIISRRPLFLESHTLPDEVEFLAQRGGVPETKVREVLSWCDALLFSKNPERYRCKWSGTATLSFQFGLPVVAPKGLGSLWGLPPESVMEYTKDQVGLALRDLANWTRKDFLLARRRLWETNRELLELQHDVLRTWLAASNL